MNVELSTEARLRMETYLEAVRGALRNDASVDVQEIESDVVRHLEHVLGDATGPVSVATVDDALARLGNPARWSEEASSAPSSDRGPETAAAADRKLAASCFGLFVVGLAAVPWVGPLVLGFAYLLARWALARAGQSGRGLGAGRWLIYTPLLALAIPTGIGLLWWVIFPLADLASRAGPSGADVETAATGIRRHGPGLAIVIAGLGAWWSLLGALAARWTPVARWLFVPLADRLERRHGSRLCAAGLGLAIAALALFLATGI